MSGSITTPRRLRPAAVALVVGRLAFGLIFLAAALAKILGASMMVAEFGEIGLGQGFRYVTGILELIGALLLFRPATVTYGAGLLAVVSAGALVAQVAVLHQDVIHTVVFAALLATIAYSYRADRRPMT